jgi:DNA repair photolyase
MDWFDFDLDEGLFRKMLRGVGRVLSFFLEFAGDLFAFWEPWEKKREQKKKRKERREGIPPADQA